jgi:hypothetical protein
MSEYDYVGNITMKLIPSSEYYFLQPTYSEIKEDIDFFLSKSLRAKELKTKKRYARAVIVFTAFYVESLANLLLEQIRDRFGKNAQMEDIINKNDHWPKPLRIFYSAYLFLNQKPIGGKKRTWVLDTSVIEDLILIRNQVFAHPPARSVVAGTRVVSGKGLTQKGTALVLKRFPHFPNIYHEFTYSHALELYEETKKFLASYGNLIASNPFEPKLASLFT